MSTAHQWFPQLAFMALGLSALVSWLVAGVVRRLALTYGWMDKPESAPHRKIHTQPVPLLGGVAVWVACVVTSILLWPVLTSGYLLPKHLLGLLVAGLILVVGGAWDDIKDLKPQVQILFPVVACVVIITSGIGIHEITNPLGGTVSLESVSLTLFTWHDLPYQLVLWADVFGLMWLMSTTYATKFLDGLDGLVAGVTVIGGLAIALVSWRAPVLQPETALVALMLAGAALGFLIWNWYPAKLFLGEGGSLFCGFSLGVLAIISGGKIATALLILGLPLLDGAWVIVKRLRSGHSPFAGDAEHIHQRLLRAGLSQRQAAWLLYAVTAGFGFSGLFLQGQQKLWALGVLVVVLVIIGIILIRFSRKSHDAHS